MYYTKIRKQTKASEQAKVNEGERKEKADTPLTHNPSCETVELSLAFARLRSLSTALTCLLAFDYFQMFVNCYLAFGLYRVCSSEGTALFAP